MQKEDIMKRYLIVLIFIITPVFASAETVTVLRGGSDDNKVIFTTTDEGESRSATAHRISDSSWLIIDQDGNSTMVNDFSSRDSD